MDVKQNTSAEHPLLLSVPGAGGVRADAQDPMVGTLFDGQYLILRRIGQGGCGAVYEAQDARRDHRIAIRILHADATRSPRELEAFKHEARRATRLSNPHIVDWKTLEQSRDGVWYLVMELLRGEELEIRMKREGPLDAKLTGRILLQVLDALRTAHHLGQGQSVLHLDLKPKNVFLIRGRTGESSDHVKVIDFGIGQFIGSEVAPDSNAPTSTDPISREEISGSRVTDANDPWNDHELAEGEQTFLSVHTFEDELGSDAFASTSSGGEIQRSTACTPEYAAPEQCAHLLPELEAVPLDGRADIYSLGVMGFQMLTGKLPFDEPERRKDLLHVKQSVEPHKVGSMGVRVPKDLAQFIDRCLARNREARFLDSNEAYGALRRIVHPLLRKRVLVAAGIVLLSAVAAAWFIGQGVAHKGLALYARIDGVERSLAGSNLHLGPARDHMLLRVFGLDASSKLDQVRFVDGRGAHANEIEGFHAIQQDDRHVLVSADPSSERIQRPAFLEVRLSGQEPTWSDPFDLVWLGEGAWQLESVAIQGLGERSVDPAGTILEVHVNGQSDDFASVRVEQGQKDFAARRDETLSRGDAGVYSVPLQALDLEAGHAELHAFVTDKAGRTGEQVLDAEVAIGPLILSDASLDSTAVGGRYSVAPHGDPHLIVASSRKADFAWLVRDANGRMLMKGSAPSVDTGRFPLTELTSLRGGAAFSGWIELVADERAYVLHEGPGNRGNARRRLDFTFEGAAPEYSVRISTPDGGKGSLLDPTHPTFFSTHDVVLHIGRESALPLLVEVVCTPVDRPEETQKLDPRLMVDREVIAADFPIPLPQEGEYDLAVRVWRYDLATKSTSRDPDSVLQARVVIDTSPAKIFVRGPSGVIALRSRTESMPRLEVGVEDTGEAAERTRTPVDLRWDLVLAQRPQSPLASGVLGTTMTGSAPVALEVPRPWSLDAKEPVTSDGTYRIVFAGIDAAGNTASAAVVTFESAVDGPVLELSRPAPRIQWSRAESGGFEIQVVARDPNGVGSVRGAVRRIGAPDVPFELRASGDPRHANVSVWTGTVVFDESWASSAIEVRLASEDGFGTLAEKTEPRELGPVDRLFPLHVAVDFDGLPVERLRLVEGNAGGAYTFGGRVDAEEERAFSAIGLPAFNSLSTPRSWRVIYESHEIPSFYLDEHEVSVEQFLAFVRADGGYASTANWPAGSAPDPARAEWLERELSTGRRDLPVADVSWEEATAYAHWVGKRLPSLVEWEFAVRGGALYRPFAGARRGARAPTREEVDYDPDVAGDGTPRPCPQEGDVTEDTGIFDLCGNVSEWTATPASFLEGAVTPLNLPAHVLENRAQFLDPRRSEQAEKSERYWVAGGSFQTARADFSVVDRRGRTWRGPAVGFRCAADVDSATAVPACAPTSRPRFRESFE